MNILMCYRTKQFKKEILPELIKHKDDIIVLLAENKLQSKILKALINIKKLKQDITVINIEDILEGKLDMKFDYIVGNPPYQETTGKTTKPIWDKLVMKFHSMLKDGGKMSLIHPGSWRFATNTSKGAIKEVKKIYTENNVVSAEFNDKIKGVETFGAITDYDVITLIKEPRKGNTKVTTLNETVDIDFRDYNLIPTDGIVLLSALKAKENEEKVEVIQSSSAYKSDFKHISTEKDYLFKYPVIYGMPTKGIKYLYSNTKDNGHFGISKLIMARAGYQTILDFDGEYGMTQFAIGIVDTKENIIKMNVSLLSKEFCLFQKQVTGSGDFNSPIDNKGTMIKFLKEFRKDFWKEFYTKEMEQELIDEGILDENGVYLSLV